MNLSESCRTLPMSRVAFVSAKDLLPAVRLGASWCSVYSLIWCSLYLEKSWYLQSPTWVFDTMCSLPVLLEGPSVLLFISELWKISWQCKSSICWKMDVALVLGILDTGSDDSRWKIHILLVMAFTSSRGAWGWYIRQQECASGILDDEIAVAWHLFLKKR